MNFKTESQLLQQQSKTDFPIVGRNRVAGGTLQFENLSLVDTRSYETHADHSFIKSEKSSSYKILVDDSTGETVQVEIATDGDYSIVKNASDNKFNSLEKGYKLLDEASKTLWSPTKGKHQHRTCKCNKVRIDSNVNVLKDTSGRTFFGGLMQCGSVWTCPICSRKINEHKASDMREAFTSALTQDHNIELLTFTFPHSINQSLKDNLKKLSSARQDFWRSGIVKRFRLSGYIGRIDSFEITYGKNGWHPHIHAVVFSKGSATAKSNNYLLLRQWVSCLFKHGLANALDMKGIERSLDIRDGSKAGEYICKFGSDGESKLTKDGSKSVHWDIADETTKAHIKSGRNGSVTPFDMLRISSSTTDNNEQLTYRKLFREYAVCMKGKSQIRWSKGLRDFYNVGEQLTDQEIVELREERAVLKAVITDSEWTQLITLEISNKVSSKQPVRTTLRYLASLDTKGTDEHSCIARYIYDRTLQTISFEDYYSNFILRNELIE